MPIFSARSIASIQSVVGGTALQVGDNRLALLPLNPAGRRLLVRRGEVDADREHRHTLLAAGGPFKAE